MNTGGFLSQWSVVMSELTPLVKVSRREVAEQIQTFLSGHQIATDIQPEGESHWLVCVFYPAQQPKAQALVQGWLTQIQRQQADYLWSNASPVKTKPGSQPGFSALLQIASRSPFMLLIATLCVVAFLASASLWFSPVRELLRFAPLGQILESGQWWRLIGPTLMHFSAMHIIFNLLWWWILGGQIERRFGTSALVILYLLTGIASNYGQYLDGGSNFGGLSGVVYGLFGFVWWIGWIRPEWGVSLPRNLIGFMLAWLALGYTNILPLSMANTAHLVGLLSGCGLAALIALIGRRQS